MVNVNYKLICPDVCPKSLENEKVGYIENGMFYPSESVARYYFEKQREYNSKIEDDNLTNIYFIQSINGGPVKIGKAKNVQQRLLGFQIGCPVKLSVVAVYKNVDDSLENVLHNKYSEYRIHGEWFDEKILEMEFGSDNTK